MEAAAAGIGKAVLNGVLSGAKAAITEDAALRQAVQRDVVFLTDELAAMRSYLRDADEERNRHKVTRSRVRHVRDLAYDVDDCLREHAVHLEKPSGWRLARTVLERHRIAEEMKGLRARAEDMNHRNLRYHLAEEDLPGASNSGNKPPASSMSSSSSSSSAENSTTLGRSRTGGGQVQQQVDLFLESGQVDLVPLICRNDRELWVIAVWGASGDPRKTSVIRKAYDDLKKKKDPVDIDDDAFESSAWIRAAHPFNPSEFLQCTVRQFYMNSLQQEAGKTTGEEQATLGAQVLKKMETMGQHHLVEEFHKHVSQKRYLIVLNELSTIEDWDWIKLYFPNNNKGSRIIVSTEQVEVASLCAGPERLVVELKQSSTDQVICAFCEKGTTELEPCSMTAATDNSDSPDKRILTSIETMEYKSQLIRRQKEIQDIIDMLNSTKTDQEHEVDKLNSNKNDREHEVVTICGKGGLGKTSLIKSIYQNEDLRTKFQKRAYVTIKHPFILTDILDSLVKQLDKEGEFARKEKDKERGGDRTKLGVKRQWLAGLLNKGKYLIVLDDLSSIKEWDTIENYLAKTNTEGRIIVTTSTENIARHCTNKKEENIYKLKRLDNEDALDLFKETVFRGINDSDGNFPDSNNLCIEADSILTKCNGFPLAILTIGGILAKQPKTLVEWRKLNEYIGAELKANPELDPIRTILVKCYDYLPYDLKSCFLYLSIFPEDHTISRRRLVHRWTAEGYSSGEHGKSAKEIADSYFMELVDRRMILPFVESIGSTKGVDSCKFNNLIHEMSTLKSSEENLVFRLEEGCCMNTQGKIRHLSVSDNWNGDRREFEDIVLHPSSIRSLTVFGKWRPFFICEKMRMLRVLDLEGTSGLNDHHLEHIGKLLHLKYLSLRWCRDICYLPNSLGNLQQLETLDVKHTGIIKLPKTITKLRKLHYLRAGGIGFLGANSYEEVVEDLPKLLQRRLCLLSICSVAYCVACCAPQLMKEFEVCNGDPNRRDVCTACCCTVFPFVARHLDLSGVRVPRGLNKLTALHTMGTVNIGHGKTILQDISKLTRLRKLGLTGLNEHNRIAFCSALSALSNNLESLSVRSVGNPGLAGCLEFDDMYSPPENLKSLKLYGNLVKLPAWIDGLQNLVKLTLRRSMIDVQEHDKAMQILDKLPNLKTLRLLEKSFQGEELLFVKDEKAFPSLTRLVLILLNNLKSVKFEQGATRNLKMLQFYGLPSISKDNLFSGLSSLQSLKEFMLDDDATYDDAFVEGLQKQLAENTNRPILKRYS